MNNITIKNVFLIVGAIIAVYIAWKMLLAGLTLMFKLILPAAIILVAIYFIYKYIKKRGM